MILFFLYIASSKRYPTALYSSWFLLSNCLLIISFIWVAVLAAPTPSDLENQCLGLVFEEGAGSVERVLAVDWVASEGFLVAFDS